MTKQDPQELYYFIRNHTGHTQPNKTIQDFAQPYKIREANRVIQQYNPFKDLISPHNTVQYHERLDGNA